MGLFKHNNSLAFLSFEETPKLVRFALKIKNLFDSHNDFFRPHNSAHPPSLHKGYQQATALSDFFSNRGDHHSCVKPTPHFLDLGSASVDIVF